jgi:hypothetical protein
VFSSLPRLHNRLLAKCGCKKHDLDLYGEHISTCTVHSGATKAHDWMVGALGPLFRTAGHIVCVYYGSTYYKAVRVGGEGKQWRTDMCYERLRAEACVD